jgi:hypothetical protein
MNGHHIGCRKAKSESDIAGHPENMHTEKYEQKEILAWGAYNT